MRTALKVLAIIQLAWGGIALIVLMSEGALDIWTFTLIATIVALGILVLIHLKQTKFI
jgi:hypothetical protein